MPFYAAITAILCVQPKTADSLEVAANREVATIIGGLAGMGFLYALHGFGLSKPDALRYALIAAALIPLISLSVWLERPKATFLTCVVFLSVVVFHEEDVQPFWFAFNRVLDTTIGIVVALIVNLIPWRIENWLHRRRGNPPGGNNDMFDTPDD